MWWCGLLRVVTLFAIFVGSHGSQLPHRRFEYKYSFKGPYLAQKDNQVPFWSYSGNAIASAESLRITPSLRSQKGQAWCKIPVTFDWWEIEVVFRVNGRGRVGADGLAFWYTATKGSEGPVFGCSDMWNGLGVFFDSFDNDNKRNNPYIMAMVNDGTKVYDHENDGMSQMLGGCLRDFRNKPHPVRAKIEFYKNTLTVYMQTLTADMLGHRDDRAAAATALYNLFHQDASSMDPFGGHGGFLLNHLSRRNPSVNETIDGTAGDDDITGGDSSPGLFGSWFAQAEEITDNEQAVNMSDAVFSDPSMYHNIVVGEQRYEQDAVSSQRIEHSSEGGWSSWLGKKDTEVFSGAGENSTFERLDNQTQLLGTKASRSGLRLAKERRKKKRLLRNERRRLARKYRRLGARKSRILVHNGMTASDKDYEICTRVENVVLPAGGYFGLSAATGGLADDHDVLKFLVTSLRSPEEMTLLESNKEQEEQFQREFKEYQEKTKKARDEYVAAHPDSQARHGEDDDDFEAGETRELRQIFQGQSQIYDVLRQLNNKMDEIIGRQERTLSLVGAVHSGLSAAAAAGGVPLPGGTPPIPAPAVGGAPVISRMEIDQIMNTQRDIAQTARDLRNIASDVNVKSTQILSNAGKPVGSAQPVGGSYDIHVTLKELSESLNSVKHTLGTQQQQQHRGSAPLPLQGCPSCLSTWMFLSVAVGQLVLIIGYMLYRDGKEAQAKKFY